MCNRIRSMAILLIAAVAACNNYNLLAQLENPGSLINERFSDRLFVFVTSQMTAGDMFALNAGSCNGTGIGKADCVCQALAAQNGLRMSSTSRFIAWLSTSVDAAKCRMLNQGGSTCKPSGPFVWYNTNYEPVFTSFESATTGLLGSTLTISNAPKYTEGRFPVPPMSDNVWTGTDIGGNIAGGFTCDNWNSFSAGFQGRTGTSDSLGSGWTSGKSFGCDLFKRIYCIAVP
ncbi:MAG: hypothetical protein OHK0011_13390 [Turneriella sp.]